MQTQAIIDVHAHCVTTDYVAAMKAAGVTDVEGFPLPRWSESEHLAMMDRQGIKSSIISVSTPGVNFVAGQKSKDLARRLNDEMAERRFRTRGRFGAIAVLPLPDVDAALREMEYALDTLKMDGVGLLSNYHGTYLGDAALDDIFAEGERRAAVFFVHPTAPPHWQEFSLGFAATALEYPFDVTRWLLKVISSGVLRRYANVTFIATHGGGTMPFLAGRVADLTAMNSRLEPPMLVPEFQEMLRRIYYDSTAVTQGVTFEAYKAFVPADRRLFGSDHPFMPETTVPPALKVLNDNRLLAPDERAKLEMTNALTLFPALQQLWVD